MRKFTVAAVASLLAWPAAGQVAQDQAAARLREKTAARATQPATQSSGDVERLRQIIADLQRQVAAMRAENQTLRQQLAKPRTPAPENAAAKASQPDDDGPGLYRIPYYIGGQRPGDASGKENYDVLANSREGALKIAVANGVHPIKQLDRDGNVHFECEKLREMTPQERAK